MERGALTERRERERNWIEAPKVVAFCSHPLSLVLPPSELRAQLEALNVALLLAAGSTYVLLQPRSLKIERRLNKSGRCYAVAIDEVTFVI